MVSVTRTVFRKLSGNASTSDAQDPMCKGGYSQARLRLGSFSVSARRHHRLATLRARQA